MPCDNNSPVSGWSPCSTASRCNDQNNNNTSAESYQTKGTTHESDYSFYKIDKDYQRSKIPSDVNDSIFNGISKTDKHLESKVEKGDVNHFHVKRRNTPSERAHRNSWSGSYEVHYENEDMVYFRVRKRCISEGNGSNVPLLDEKTEIISVSDEEPKGLSPEEKCEDIENVFVDLEEEDKPKNLDTNNAQNTTGDTLERILNPLTVTDAESTEKYEHCSLSLLSDAHTDQNGQNDSVVKDPSNPGEHLKEVVPKINEYTRNECCNVCTNNYVEMHHKIDHLTHEYQTCSSRLADVVSTKIFQRNIQIQMKFTKYFWAMIQVIFYVIFLCTGAAVLMITNRWGAEALKEELIHNLTNSLATLDYQYGSMTEMVQDLTKTRPVIKVTSHSYSSHDNKYFVTWATGSRSGQGNLRLSNRRDSIIAKSAGYYLITCNLLFMFNVNSQRYASLEYDVYQKVKSSHKSVHRALYQFPVNQGVLRQNVDTHIVVYLFPGDEILIGLNREQKEFAAKFKKAHTFSMFQID